MAIHAVFIVNNTGKPRLTKFFVPGSAAAPAHARAAAVARIYDLISTRPDSLCNFVELPPGGLQLGPAPTSAADPSGKGKGREEPSELLRVVFRNYATLYFVFVVDEAESELGILDLIQVFVEALDRCFANVCELDLIFHFDEVHTLLSCMIIGGYVCDTNLDSIAASFRATKAAKTTSANAGSLTAQFSDVGGNWRSLALPGLRGRS